MNLLTQQLKYQYASFQTAFVTDKQKDRQTDGKTDRQ